MVVVHSGNCDGNLHAWIYQENNRVAPKNAPAADSAQAPVKPSHLGSALLDVAKDGSHGVVIPNLPGCTSAGKTADAAYCNAFEARHRECGGMGGSHVALKPAGASSVVARPRREFLLQPRNVAYLGRERSGH